MRDALSVLDQCLSFGEGKVTGARVREVLGLVEDELYAEVLGLVADRRPEAVFPLVDRLVDAGADLVEFIGGAGELLRALLMLRLGTAPEGLTEAVRESLERYRDRLEPGDAVRMLRLLADSEPLIRRSANPRLVVETLLLRWAMMDRTVDLREVLRADEPGAPPRPAPVPGRTAPEPRVLRDAVPGPGPASPRPAPATPETPAPAAATPAAAAPAGGREAPGGVAEAWPDIVADVRARSRFLGEALADTTPGALEGSTLPVLLAESNPLFAERIQAEAAAVEDVVRRHTGQAVRIRVTVAEGQGAAQARPRPLTESSLRADRLRSFRAKDPALDTAADALDLEIVD
jgi:DNA polymerase-3 subunit gamma/tau